MISARVVTFLMLLEAMVVVSGDESCLKQVTFNGLDDEEAISELQELISRHVRDGNSVDIYTEIRDDTPITQTTRAPKPLPNSCVGMNMSLAKSRNETGGVFDIDVTNIGRTEVYCDMTTDGGNWTVFQRRMDGSVDFYRNWTDYVKGFGNASREFWLGLKAIHKLTKGENCELRIDMTARNGTRYHVKYSAFQVGPSADKYKLSVSGYSGNITDSLTYHSDQPFSTRDLTPSAGECAILRKGAWWYNGCTLSHLNGLYSEELDGKTGITWYTDHTDDDLNWIYMKFTEMKLRCNT